MHHKLGLPIPVIILLATPAVPRVFTHDLGLFPEGSFVNRLLVFVPPGLEPAVFGVFAFFGSIITGTVVVAIVGLVASVIERARRT